MMTTHNGLTGRENDVTRTFRGGVVRTFRRANRWWDCVEQPLAKKRRHLRDAVRDIKRMRGELEKTTAFHDDDESEVCPRCEGRTLLCGEPCPHCDGTGYIDR